MIVADHMAAEPEGHSPEVNQFEIKTSDHLTPTERDSVNQILIAAVMHLALLRAPGNKLVPFPVGEFRDGGWILVKEEEGVLTFLSALT